MPEFHLCLFALIPSADARRVLAVPDADGRRAIPSLRLTVASGDAVAGLIGAALRQRLGVDRPLLEVHVPDTAEHGEPEDGTIDVLVVVDPARDDPTSDAAADATWLATDEALASVPKRLRPRLQTWTLELAGAAEPPRSRPPWSRAGWQERATSWMRTELEAQGRTVTGPAEQVRIWGISSLVHAPTESGWVYLKGCFSMFRHEPAVSRLLNEIRPGATPTVLAGNDIEGWMLLQDFGDVTVRGVRDGVAPALDGGTVTALLVALQRAAGPRHAAFRAVGCPHRPLSRLPAEFDRAIGVLPQLAGVEVNAARPAELSAWVTDRAASVDAVGAPDALVHGDFHGGNVAIVDGAPLIFDWSDATLSFPFIDAVTWLGAIGEGEERERQQRGWRAWLDAWGEPRVTTALEDRLPDVVGVGAAYQLASLVTILGEMEPDLRYTLRSDVAYYLAALEGQVRGR